MGKWRVERRKEPVGSYYFWDTISPTGDVWPFMECEAAMKCVNYLIARDKKKEQNMSFNTNSQDKAVCPYCGYADIDSWELLSDWDESGTTWCPECDEKYEWSVYISHSYTTNKIEEENE